MIVKRLDLTPHKSPSRGVTILDNERQGNMSEQAQAYKAKAGQFLSKGFGLTSYGNRKGTMSGIISEALESKAGLNIDSDYISEACAEMLDSFDNFLRYTWLNACVVCLYSSN